MLFDKVLLQTLSTDIWRATTTTCADYSAEVIFSFLVFEIFNNRLYQHLTLYDHNNLCGGECICCISCIVKSIHKALAKLQQPLS